jgi:Zn-finger nucleic acid-binding protein
MKCPVCKTAYLDSFESDDMPAKLVCDRCGGLWIKAYQYWKWLMAHGENLPEKPADDGESLPVTDSTNAKLCPECGRFLSRKKVGHGVDFHIDRCATCGGFWFDKNEWEILKSRNLHDDVHFIFSSAWQHRIADEDRRETYDKRISIILGQHDWTRASDFKNWTAIHPKRSTIMAYLADIDA